MVIPMAVPGKSGPAMIKVEKILERIRGAEEERFPAVGFGRGLPLYLEGTDGVSPGGR